MNESSSLPVQALTPELSMTRTLAVGSLVGLVVLTLGWELCPSLVSENVGQRGHAHDRPERRSHKFPGDGARVG